jgi:hypothetical protein
MVAHRKLCLVLALTFVPLMALTTVALANTQDKVKGSSPPTIAAVTLADITADKALATNVHVISDVVAATRIDKYGQVTTSTANTDQANFVATIKRTNEQGTYLELSGTVTATNNVAENVATRSRDMAMDQLGK